MGSDLHKHIDGLNAQAYLIRNASSGEAGSLAEEALRLSEEAHYKRGIGCALRTLAAARASVCLTSAYANAVKSIEILLAEGDVYEACSAYPVLFIYYANTGRTEMAYLALEKCLELATQSGNRYVEAIGAYNLGSFQLQNHEGEKARVNFRSAVSAALSIRNLTIFGLAMGELASLFADGKEEFFDYAQLMAVKEDLYGNNLGGFVCEPGHVQVLRAQFIYLMATGDRAGGVRAYREGRQLCKSTGNTREYLRAMTSRAECFVRSGELVRAKNLLTNHVKVLKAAGHQLGEHEVLLRLANVEEQLGNFQAAYQNLMEHCRIKETLACADSEARHRELEVLYRTNQLAEQATLAKLQAESLTVVNEQLHTALERQTELQKELMRLASTDELTGAVNRRQIVNDGILEMERYRHTGAPFSVTVIDVDHFKVINDTFGHATGDEVLRRLTKCCQSLLRRFDVFGRLGGEEFCIVHHDTDMAGAIQAVNRLMKAIEVMFMADILPDRQFSVSIGIAEVHDHDASFYDVLHLADMALYEAKRAGRNTFRTAQSRTLEAA